jgi:hypothetical protein
MSLPDMEREPSDEAVSGRDLLAGWKEMVLRNVDRVTSPKTELLITIGLRTSLYF